MQILTELLTPNLEMTEEIIEQLTVNDQAIFKHILISIENGGEPVNDPQTL